MAMIPVFLSSLAKLLATFLGRVLANEFDAWNPVLINWLISNSVKILPESKRSRFEEEWKSYVEEIPGKLGKLYSGFGFVIAVCNVSFAHAVDDLRANRIQRASKMKGSYESLIDTVRKIENAAEAF
jgi:hypothetical protein